MAYVEMKCPNCGAPMTGDGNRFTCPHCGTAILNVIDAKIDSDVTVMSAEEFTARLEANKKSFVINVNDRLEEFDVDTMVTNKKIKTREFACKRRIQRRRIRFEGYTARQVFSVERLYYLASMRVKTNLNLPIAPSISAVKRVRGKSKRSTTARCPRRRADERDLPQNPRILPWQRTRKKRNRRNKQIVCRRALRRSGNVRQKMCQNYPQAAHVANALRGETPARSELRRKRRV
ncbi:MAG: hypothetical protein ACLUSP_09440 [Christensenellales bacterium]